MRHKNMTNQLVIEDMDDGISALNAIYFLICDAAAPAKASQGLQIPAANLSTILKLAIEPIERARQAIDAEGKKQ
jgi:hypothetical protein